MDNQKIIGIDIGATKIHVGMVRNGEVIDEVVFATPSQSPEHEVVTEIIKGVEKLIDPDVAGIGIGVPGLVDEEKGVVYDLWNIPSWKEVFLKKYLEDHFSKPVHITNDANTFVLGEKIYGKGSAFKNLVGLTLGSGFGTGIVIHDQLYSGTISSAGELASIPYLDSNIEDYCSGKFFRKQFNMDGGEVYVLARNGDQKAKGILNQYGTHLGNTIKTILYILSPQAIFLGGSVSASYEFFKDSLNASINEFPFKRVTSRLTIEPSAIKNASVLGAAALINMREHNK